MPSLLKIGVSVAGVSQIEKLNDAVIKTTGALSSFSDQSILAGRAGLAMTQNTPVLIQRYKELQEQAEKTYRSLNQSMSGTGFDNRAKVEGEVVAISQLQAVKDKYVSSLAAQKVLEDSTAQSINRETAAVLAQSAAYQKLQTKGITPVSGPGQDYVKQLEVYETHKKMGDDYVKWKEAQTKKLADIDKFYASGKTKLGAGAFQADQNFMDEQFVAMDASIEKYGKLAAKKKTAMEAFYASGKNKLGLGADVSATKELDFMNEQFAAMGASIEKYGKLALKKKAAMEAFYASGKEKLGAGAFQADQNFMDEQFAAMDASIKKIEKLAAEKAVAMRLYNEAGKASLKGGNYASQIAAEAKVTGFDNVSVESIARYDAVSKKLLNAKEVAAGFEAEMKKTAEAVTSVHPPLTKMQTVLQSLGVEYGKTTAKGRSFHDLLRGGAGASGGLWLTYGDMVPMIAGFAAVGGVLKTISAGTDFDSTIRQIQILAYGAEQLTEKSASAATNLEEIRAKIQGMGDSPFSKGDLAKGILEFSRAGVVDLDEAVKAMDQVAKFAYIGGMEIGKTTEMVVGLASAFKGLDKGEALNTMAIVADKTSINLQQMTEAFKNTTSLGTVMKADMKDVAVAIGVMGQAGIRGATAGAALSTMMYKLIAPTAAAEKMMNKLGVQFDAFDAKTGRVKSIKDIAFELANLTRNLKPNQVSEMFESMVGIRGVKALGALVDMAKSAPADFDRLSASVQKGGTYLDGYLKLLEKSGKFQLDQLKAQFDDLFTTNYDNASVVNALKNLKDVVGSTDVKSAFADITSGVLEVTAVLAKLFAMSPEAFIGGLGILGIIVGRHPVVASITTALAGLKMIDDYVDKRREGITGQKQTSSSLNPISAYGEFTDSLKVLFSGANKEIDATAGKIDKTKAALVSVNVSGVELIPEAQTAEAVTRLETVGNYFDSIMVKIEGINKTPLQLIDDQIEQNMAGMMNAMASGGLTLDQMVATATATAEKIRNVGEESTVAGAKIEAMGMKMEAAGGDKAKIEALKAAVREIAVALGKKELEKINKAELASMTKEWQSYATEVMRMQDEMAKNQRSIQDEIRKLDQSKMSPMEKWNDDKKRVAENEAEILRLYAQSSEALKNGDLIGAKNLEGQAKTLASATVSIITSMQETVSASSREINDKLESTEQFVLKMQNLARVAKLSGTSSRADGYDSERTAQTVKNAEAKLLLLKKDKESLDKLQSLDKNQTVKEKKALLEEINQIQTKGTQEYILALQKIGQLEQRNLNIKKGLPADTNTDMTHGMGPNAAAAARKAMGQFVTPLVVDPAQAAATAETLKAAGQATGAAIAEGATKAATALNVAGAEFKAQVFKDGNISTGLFSKEAGAGQANQNTNVLFGNGSTEEVAKLKAEMEGLFTYMRQLQNSGVDLTESIIPSSASAEVQGYKAKLEELSAQIQSMSTDNAPGIEGKLQLEQAKEDLQNLKTTMAALLQSLPQSQAPPIIDPQETEQAAQQVEAVGEKMQTLMEKLGEWSEGNLFLEGFSKIMEGAGTAAQAFFDEAWTPGWTDAAESSIEQIGQIEQAILNLVNQTYTATINVERVEGNSVGGYIQGFQIGGYLQKLAQGGMAKNVTQGAFLGGYGGGDRRLLFGEDGEFMLRKERVAAAGRDAAEAFNDGRWPDLQRILSNKFGGGLTGYAAGGYIGTSAPAIQGGSGNTAIFNFADTKETATLTGSQTDIDILQRGLQRRARLRSA